MLQKNAAFDRTAKFKEMVLYFDMTVHIQVQCI